GSTGPRFRGAGPQIGGGCIVTTAPVIVAPVVADSFHIDPPSAAPAGMSERAIQRQMLVMVRRLFPGCLVSHVPNGARRGKLEAVHIKAEGVLPGFRYLNITWPGRAAFLEVKDRDGAVSASQKE